VISAFGVVHKAMTEAQADAMLRGGTPKPKYTGPDMTERGRLMARMDTREVMRYTASDAFPRKKGKVAAKLLKLVRR
jgi:hypothetical protein